MIREVVHQVFDEQVRIILFGSRVDDRLKGGDIDIMIEANQPIARPAL